MAPKTDLQRAQKRKAPAHGVLVWGWGVLVALGLWVGGFFLLPWWAALFLWWWPSALAGGAVALLGMGVATGTIARLLLRGPLAIVRWIRFGDGSGLSVDRSASE
jgi:hypothetical protein